MLSEIIFTGYGNYTFKKDTSLGFVIDNFNSSWIFENNKNITANIVKASDTLLFGIKDSVKHILLSTGDLVLLSKNNGILQFPVNYGSKKYYTLAGINEKKAGVTLPGYNEIFNFEIGDMFEYHDTTGRNMDQFTTIKQYTITSKTQLSDSVVYTFEGHIREKGKGSAFSGTLKYPTSMPHALDKNYRELSPKDPFTLKTHSQYDTIGINYNNTFNTYIKNFYDYDATILLKPNNDSDYVVSLMLGTDGYQYFTEYGPGLGMINYIYATVLIGKTSALVAHKNSKRTIGTFTPLEIILAVNEDKPKKNNFNIYPNPANAVISVFNNSNANQNFSYQLSDLQGKEILSATEKGEKATINIEHLPKGIYILKVFNDLQKSTHKIIKN